METIQQRIRQIREKQNLSIEEFAQIMGTFTRNIIHIESERWCPQVSFIAKLHNLYPQYSLQYLIYGNGKQEENVGSDVDMSRLEPLLHEAAAGITKSKSLDIEEVRQTIANLKRGIARIESWLNDMDEKSS